MGPVRRLRGTATFDDLVRLGRLDDRVEIIDGEVVERAGPSGRHADAQAAVVSLLRPKFHRRGGGSLGGWWIFGEADIELETHEIFVPDLAGWRRDRVPERPVDRPIRVRPDWVCEVLSPSNSGNDTVRKMWVYHRVGIRHYWIVDPEREELVVYRHSPDGYLALLTAGRGELVRAEPFDAIELNVGVLFGDEPEDEPAPSP